MRTLCKLLALMALLNLTNAVFSQTELLDAYDIFGLEYASQPMFSPNGEQIVYVRRQLDVMSDRNIGHVWIMDVDGGGHQPLTSGVNSASNPTWSPDGTRIAWIGQATGQTQLHVLWLDSGRTAQLTTGPHAPGNLSWSNDSSQLAFTRFVPSAAPSLVAPLNKPAGADWAPEPTVIDRPVFRVDGQGFLPHGQTQRFVVSADGGAAQQITAGPYPQIGAAVWTRDDAALIFSANRREDFALERNDSELFQLNLASGELIALTRRYGPDTDPQLSPDGRSLAWLGFDDELMSYTNTELYVMDLDDGEARLLTAPLDRNVDDFRWASNGRSLYISYSESGVGVIDRLPVRQGAADRERIAVDLGGTTMGRPYASGQFDAGQGRVVWTRTRPSHPGDLFLTNGRESQRLTRLNRALLEQHQLAEVERFRFPSSHDGLEIEGWLAYPPGYDANQRYPLILEIHGGPFADYGPRFSMEVQLMAAAGYLVAYINPRGSTSYGAAFANTIHHAYPGYDYDDLI
ncbi:MAG: prolyl oligopeptidase family serine peptidase, partial [Pseudomonadota bacterium]